MGSTKSFIGRFNSLFPNCRETTLRIIMEQERGLTVGEKLKMLFHVYIVCRFCRVFRNQSGILHNHVHHVASHSKLESSVFVLNEKQKQEIQEAIDRMLTGTDN